MPVSGENVQFANRFGALGCKSLSPDAKLGSAQVVGGRSECVLGGLERQSPLSDQQVQVDAVVTHL